MNAGIPTEPAVPEPVLQRESGAGVERDPALMSLWARRGRACLIHAVLMAGLLLAIRANKILLVGLPVPFGIWFQSLAAELSLVLLIEAAWLLTVRIGPPKARWWAAAFVLFHLPIYLLVISGHRFFLETHIMLKWEVLGYTLREVAMLRELLTTGFDTTLAGLMLAATACLAAFLVVLGLRRPRWGASILIPGIMTLTGAALSLVPAPHHVRFVGLAGNWLVDLFPDRELEEYRSRVVQVRPLYVAPQLMSSDVGNSVAVKARPNFLLLILEGTNTDVFSVYTGQPALSPFLDQLAMKSLVVDNAYTTVSHTTKALVGILCGMHPIPTMAAVEARPQGLPLTCLPHLLREVGYTTRFFQSAVNFENRLGLVTNMGFESAFIPSLAKEPVFKKAGYLGFDERVMMEPAIRWMTAAQQPFFAALLTLSTHHPYESDGSGEAPARERRRAYYDRAVAHVDEEIRLLFEQLANSGLLENTVVIIVGDHGEAFGERSGFFQHDRVPYQEVVRTPLLLHAPQMFGPGRVQGLRQHTDILPTVLELAELPWQGVLPGKSLLSSPGHSYVVTSCWYDEACLSLRQGNWSFVFHFGRIPLEVFDLASDPGQLHNLADQVDEATQEQVIDVMLGELASTRVHYSNAGFSHTQQAKP